jgi:hypothetical protein
MTMTMTIYSFVLGTLAVLLDILLELLLYPLLYALSLFQQSSSNSNSNSNDALVMFDEDSSDEGTTEGALVVMKMRHNQSSPGRTNSNTNATQEMVVFSDDAIVDALNGLVISDPDGTTVNVLTTQSARNLMASMGG